MAVKTFVSGETLTAADTNTYLANSGLVFIKQVTVGSGVTSVNVTACFSTDFDNYFVSWSNIASANDAIAMRLQLLVSTTANASNFDGNTYYVITGAAGALTNSNLTASSFAECGSLTNAYTNGGTCSIQQPNLANASYVQFSGADDNYFRFGAYVLKNTTQYDGFKLLPASGTLTGGTITVYGYRKG